MGQSARGCKAFVVERAGKPQQHPAMNLASWQTEPSGLEAKPLWSRSAARRFFLLGVGTTALWLVGCSRLDWVDLNAPDAKFSISIPGAPRRVVKTLDYPAGSVRVVGYLSTIGDDTAFGISAARMPDFVFKRMTADQLLDYGVRTAMDKYPNTPSSVTNTIFQGNPARHFTLGDANTKFVVEANVYLVSNRVYTLTVVHSPKSLAAETQRFFDSFQPK